MTQEIRTIGVLTSGGDAPGMNAAIRAVVRTAVNRGMRVYGIRRGYEGLILGDMEEMNLRSVSDVIGRGGTFLYSARCPEFKTEEGQNKAVEMCHKMGIEGLVTCGGDGTFMGASALSRKGIPCIGIPCTIDNDIACTDFTIGFDTAVNTAVEMIDRVRDTSQSHHRCTVVEVMGRNSGAIALHAGIATGAVAVVVPEIPYDLDGDIIPKMMASRLKGKQHFVIIVAEGVGNAEEIGKYIEQKVDIVTRTTILGHVQRGGSPSARDRLLASQMAYAAVELLEHGVGNRVMSLTNGHIVSYDIQEALQMKRPFDLDLYRMAEEISL